MLNQFAERIRAINAQTDFGNPSSQNQFILVLHQLYSVIDCFMWNALFSSNQFHCVFLVQVI